MLLILFDRLISRTRSVTDLFVDHSDLMDSNEKHSEHLDTPNLYLPLLAKIKLCYNVCLHPKVCNILWALWGPLNNTKYEEKEGERGNIWELIVIIVCNYFSMATSNQNMFGVKILHQRNISTNVLMFYCKCNRYGKTATSEASDSCVHKEMALSGFRGQGAPYTFVSNNV